ncbi:MAG: GNAT family N-acetyltransferase [Clostridiaceae bacterium]|mgnify:CR=1 FL=1|nr:GNAT family N-acetyltransferase [Clostridiaceae bacterium]
MYYSFIIREANVSDAEAIYAILQTSFKEYQEATGITDLEALKETVEDVREQIKLKTVYIAAIDDKVVGTLRLSIRNDEAYLSRFAVDPKNRNSGIGELLMTVADKFLKDQGVKKITLHTSSKHISLMRFYYGRGFYVESIETDRGYPRAKLTKELNY